jgi:hypothetical protein
MSIATPNAKTSAPAGSTGCDGVLPPLESGDRLSRDEFMRRYEAMPNRRPEVRQLTVSDCRRIF